MVPRISDVEIRLLRLFVAVVEAGGFAAAQSQLNLSLPTISGQMARLEGRLGMRLCDRGRRGFRLTEEGSRIYDLARSVLRSLEDFRSEVGMLNQNLVGQLNIAVADNIANNDDCPLHGAIAAFDARPNAVEIKIEVTPPLELERAVAEGRFHLGVGPDLFAMSTLDYRPLFREVQHLYCGAKHPLFEQAPQDPTDREVEAARFVAHSCPIPTSCSGARLRPSAIGEHMESIAILILSGRYIGFLPDHCAQHWALKGEMRAIAPDRYLYVNVFNAITRKRERPTRALSTFLNDLTST